MRVGAGRATGDDGIGLVQDRAQHGAGAGGGGDQSARAYPEAKAELEHVPALARLAPLGDLVTPGEMMFGAAQGLGRGAGKQHRFRPADEF